MADTKAKTDTTPIYAATNILHGRADGDIDPRTKKIVPIEYKAGAVVDTTLFTKDEIADLLEAGSLSRVNPVVEELPALTVDDLTAGPEPVDPEPVDPPKP